MKYVVDASVALKWVLPEAQSGRAKQLRDDFGNRVHELLAPDVFPVEIAHSLTRAERKRIVPVGYAKAFLADILGTPPRLYPYLPLLSKATDLSSEVRLGVYDCLYIALAEREGCALVTADDRLVRNLQNRFPFIQSLAAMP